MNAGPPLHIPENVPDEETEKRAEGSVLLEAVRLEFPTFEVDTPRRERADKLEDYIERSARMRGKLAELRLGANTDLKLAHDEWETLEVRATAKNTLAQERARHRPDLARKIRDAKWTVDRCTEEMKRMDSDYDSASRAYTIVSGS